MTHWSFDQPALSFKEPVHFIGDRFTHFFVVLLICEDELFLLRNLLILIIFVCYSISHMNISQNTIVIEIVADSP